MPHRSDVIYIHDGSFEGLLTAVFEAYARRPAPAAIARARLSAAAGVPV